MANRNILGIAILGGLAAHAVAAYFIVKLAISLIGTAIGADGQNVFYKMLFFPDDKVACRANFTKRHGCTNSTCQFSHDTDLSYAQLMKQVSSARKTIDLCVFTITCRDLSEIVIDLFNKGVAVRVITDDEQVDATGSQIGEFRAAGIPVRQDRSSFFMHHKFALLDGATVLSGSFNWTRQAITGNNENILITNNTQVVQAYTGEFEKLWMTFNPANYST